jgi:sodium transport system ATP-binding protein
MEATIVVKDLRKTFRQSAKQMKINHSKEKIKVAVDGISFETFPGEIFGLLGPNGAGKTTTLRCIATLIRPDSGEIKVKVIDASDELAIKKSIAFLTNEIRLEDQMTPNYAFDYYARFHEMPQELIHARRKELFDYFGINDFSEVKIGDLSTGMKQKVSIAVSLAHDPDVIIFDEPTNGLDILTAKSVTDYLKELSRQGKTVIISTHIMGLVEKLCDRAGIIINGKMVMCDTVKNVRALSPTNDLEDVFFEIYQKGGLTE